MPRRFNPSDLCTPGMEWFPTKYGVHLLQSDTDAVAIRVTATDATTIHSVWTAFRGVVGSDAWACFELYDLTALGGSIPDHPTTVKTYYPTSDLYQAPKPWQPWRAKPSGYTTGSTWDHLDAVTLTPAPLPSAVPADHNEMVIGAFGEGYDFVNRFNGTLAGADAIPWYARIVRIRVRGVVAQYFDYSTPPPSVIRPYLWMNGRRYFGPSTSVAYNQGPVEIVHDWYMNPDIAMPWTYLDAQRFALTNGIGWQANGTGSSNILTALLQSQLIIEYTNETRLRVGNRDRYGDVGRPIDLPGWQWFWVEDVGSHAAAPINLVPGHEYAFVFRRSAGQATIGIPYMEDLDGPIPGPPHVRVSRPVFDPDTRLITDLGMVTNEASPILLVNDWEEGIGFPRATNALVTNDSQPYVTMTTSASQPVDNWDQIGYRYDNSRVYGQRMIQQRFTAATSGDYGYVQLVCCQQSTEVGDALYVGIHRLSDNSLVGFTAINSVDLKAPKTLFQRVGVVAFPATLIGGEQYYFSLYSHGSEEGRGWLVQCLNTLDTPVNGPAATRAPASRDSATYGGTSDFAMFGNSAQPGKDFLINLSKTPPTPTGFLAVSNTQQCCISSVTLVWDQAPSIECGTVAAWIIQRRDDPDLDWHSIARITHPDVNSFTDYESLRNKQAEYRLRLERSDGVVSGWTPTVTGIAIQGGCTGLLFTSNLYPDRAVFYQDIGQERTFEFPENDAEYEPQGADYRVFLTESRNRGVRFTATLRVRAGRAGGGFCLPECADPTGFGTDVFRPLMNLTRSDVPYVCVHNEAGNRFFARVRTPSGDWRQHGSERQGGWASYTMPVEVIEVSGVPFPVDSTGPTGGSDDTIDLDNEARLRHKDVNDAQNRKLRANTSLRGPDLLD